MAGVVTWLVGEIDVSISGGHLPGSEITTNCMLDTVQAVCMWHPTFIECMPVLQ
jgi:hypothetical protein